MFKLLLIGLPQLSISQCCTICLSFFYVIDIQIIKNNNEITFFMILLLIMPLASNDKPLFCLLTDTKKA